MIFFMVFSWFALVKQGFAGFFAPVNCVFAGIFVAILPSFSYIFGHFEGIIMNKHINHISGLIPALRRKAELLRQWADESERDKEGRSALPSRLREEAASLEAEASSLEAVLAD
jgi:hypothetical protein